MINPTSRHLLVSSLLAIVAACGGDEKTNTGTRPVLAELCDPAACAGDPGPLAPNYVCANGAIAGPACVQDGTAACSWQVLDCAEDDACTQEECGPAPG